ncbi:MAG: DEAD/DEAH box helicase, partial [Acidobacteriaceae bacterium]
YLSDRLADLLPPRAAPGEPLSPREDAILAELARGGALFFTQLHEAIGNGYPGETVDALWSLVWRGLVTNDTLHALRAWIAKPASPRSSKRVHNQQAFRSRRTTPASAQGRWTLLPMPPRMTPGDQTAWSHAIAQQLLHRYGIVTRETVAQENLPGGFSAVYDVLKALEAQGRVRRGYFIAGLGGAQFAQAAAVDLLRSLRSANPEKPEVIALAANDPANPWGSILRWPETEDPNTSLTRSVGATVILRNGDLLAYLRRNNPAIQVFLPADEPDRSAAARDLAAFLFQMAQELLQNPETRHHGGLLIDTIGSQPAYQHFLARLLEEAGFHASPRGYQVRYIPVGT